ncbi:MAG: flagellar protein FlgN [Firmicutes bacterium]|nr:flagellar protein FlgN [Bacillota bacterium]
MTALEALQAALDEELSVYRELHRLTREKRQQILQGDWPGLRGTVERELELLAQLDRWESRRLAATAAVAADLDLEPRATLQELTRHLPPEPARALTERRLALLTVMDEVARLNATNESLLSQSLAYVDFSLNLLRRAAGTAYDAAGRAQPAVAPAPARWQRRA